MTIEYRLPEIDDPVRQTNSCGPPIILQRATTPLSTLNPLTSRSSPAFFGWQPTGVSRGDLIAEVQLAIEKGELKVARRMGGAGSLICEPIQMRMDDYGGEHDDLVMALALACRRARRKNVEADGVLKRLVIVKRWAI